MKVNYNYSKDKDFLWQISKQHMVEHHVKITLLNWSEEPLREIQGLVTGGSINLDGKSSVRRTGSLSVFLTENDYAGITNVGNLFSINKKVYIEIGYKNTTDKYTEHDIIWFPQGVFIINGASSSHSVNGVNISLQLKDKMCLLNGECGGVIPASTQLDEIETIDEKGNIIIEKPTIVQIIRELVNHFGGEQLGKILISDVSTRAKMAMKWIGSLPLYFVRNNGTYKLTTDYSEINEDESTTLSFDQDNNEIEASKDFDLVSLQMEGQTTQNSLLPIEYQQVSYIESTGTQYIDTGIIASNTLGFETKIMYNSGRFGAYAYIDEVDYRHHLYDDGKWGFGKGSSKYGTAHEAGSIYTIMCNYYNDYLYKEDGIKTNDLPSSEFNLEKNFWLFTRNGGNYFNGRIYYFKMTDGNTLVRNFIPCYRKSDGEIGLYDLVNNIFYTNQGTDVFTKGYNVNSPSPEYPQKMINSGIYNSETKKWDYEVTVHGKNLFNPSKVQLNYNGMSSVLNEDGSVTSSGCPTVNYTNCITYYDISNLLKENVKYTISQSGDSHKIYLQINVRNKETGVTSYPNLNNQEIATITAQPSLYTYYIGVQTGLMTNYGSESLEITNYYQLEEGDTATDFEPYYSKTYTVSLSDPLKSLPGNEVKDLIAFENDTFKTVRYVGSYTFTGNENIQNLGTTTDNYTWWYTKGIIPNMARLGSNIKIYSNRAEGTVNASYKYWANNYITQWADTSADCIFAMESASIGTTKEEVQTYLKNNSTTAYYQLATPTEETISTAEIEMIDGTSIIEVNAGDIDINYSGKYKTYTGDYGYTKYTYGEDVGYIYTDYTYPSELIANPGDSVVTILDKIKNTLGNFEYFYDIDGNFRMQEIKNYLNTSQATDILSHLTGDAKATYSSQEITTEYGEIGSDTSEIDFDTAAASFGLDDSVIFQGGTDGTEYVVDYSKGKSILDFADNELVTAISNSPQYSKIKNDFVVWGVRKNSEGLELPIRYHLAIDKKPKDGNMYEVYFYIDPDDNIEKAIIPIDYESKSKFPEVGANGIIYRDISTGSLYKWEDEQYVQVSELPSSYTQLQYITTSGIEYIDTGVLATNSAAELSLQFINNTTSNQAVFGARGIASTASNKSYNLWWNVNQNTLRLDWTSNGNASYYANLNEDIYIYLRKNGDVQIGENTFEHTDTKQAYDANLLIGTFQEPDRVLPTGVCANWKRVKIYSDDALVRDFVPCKRNSDNVVGMFDIVNNKFYTNAGTGSFTPGPLYIGMTLTKVQTADWRSELYLQGVAAEPLGLDSNYYYAELQNEWPKLYDLKAEYHSEGDYYTGAFRPEVLKNQNEIDYFLDFFDSDTKISEISVNNIGRRSAVSSSNEINCVFCADIPDYVLIELGQEDTEEKRQECISKGQAFIQVDSNIYSLLSIGGGSNSAYEKIRSLLYQDTSYNESIQITTLPIYYLEPNTRITVRDPNSDVYGDYVIQTISMPLAASGTSSISATRALTQI